MRKFYDLAAKPNMPADEVAFLEKLTDQIRRDLA
jgi:hypothetical protein